MEYGNGGWARVTSNDIGGWLYLRLRLDRGRPLVAEFYYDARGGELTAKVLRELPFANLIIWASRPKVRADAGTTELDMFTRGLDYPYADLFPPGVVLQHDVRTAGAPLGGRLHACPVRGSDVSQAPMRTSPRPITPDDPPAPAPAPREWPYRCVPPVGGRELRIRGTAETRPAKALAEMTGHSPRDESTVGWQRQGTAASCRRHDGGVS